MLYINHIITNMSPVFTINTLKCHSALSMIDVEMIYISYLFGEMICLVGEVICLVGEMICLVGGVK